MFSLGRERGIFLSTMEETFIELAMTLPTPWSFSPMTGVCVFKDCYYVLHNGSEHRENTAGLECSSAT